jgi:hypothetical protein
MKQLLDRQQNLDEEFDADEPEFVDSDSDPAWTPAAKVVCSVFVYCVCLVCRSVCFWLITVCTGDDAADNVAAMIVWTFFEEVDSWVLVVMFGV